MPAILDKFWQALSRSFAWETSWFACTLIAGTSEMSENPHVPLENGGSQAWHAFGLVENSPYKTNGNRYARVQSVDPAFFAHFILGRQHSPTPTSRLAFCHLGGHNPADGL